MFSRLRKHFGRGNVDSGETKVKESSLSSQSNDGQRQHFWGMLNAGRETSSPGTELSENQAKKEKEKLIKELQLITEERNDLRDRLRFLTERSMKNRRKEITGFWLCCVGEHGEVWPRLSIAQLA
ncbi:uncharacterized protein LOC134483212 isoform X2 [Rattus norvegicus]|uniref:uncharacterized protein LOC134483212 isoform X2 n=1 Tax=Rattus norvegicus TaxID=10116 RepID=UPI002FD8362F